MHGWRVGFVAATAVNNTSNRPSEPEPPFREAEFEIMYGSGISREGEIIEIGSAQNIIEKAGSWYSYKGERIGQGKDNVREFLKNNPQIARDIEEQIRIKLLPVKSQRTGETLGVGPLGIVGEKASA